jgi:hypothetical protein
VSVNLHYNHPRRRQMREKQRQAQQANVQRWAQARRTANAQPVAGGAGNKWEANKTRCQKQEDSNTTLSDLVSGAHAPRARDDAAMTQDEMREVAERAWQVRVDAGIANAPWERDKDHQVLVPAHKQSEGGRGGTGIDRGLSSASVRIGGFGAEVGQANDGRFSNIDSTVGRTRPQSAASRPRYSGTVGGAQASTNYNSSQRTRYPASGTNSGRPQSAPMGGREGMLTSAAHGGAAAGGAFVYAKRARIKSTSGYSSGNPHTHTHTQRPSTAGGPGRDLHQHFVPPTSATAVAEPTTANRQPYSRPHSASTNRRRPGSAAARASGTSASGAVAARQRSMQSVAQERMVRQREARQRADDVAAVSALS